MASTIATSSGSARDLPSRAAVEAIDITKRFGPTTALDRVHLRVDAGEAHALVGRNGAGKSTLVSIITGLAAPDAGDVRFRGEQAPPLHDRHAWRRLVACVYQKSTIIPSLSIAENLFLNRQHTARRLISWQRMRADAQRILEDWGIDVDSSRTADVLPVEQRQMLEIARALAFGARFIILDEPTAQLDPKGVQRLFERLHTLRGQGIAYLYISHHLAEIYEICQSVTVFRDAQHIVTAPVDQLASAELIKAMTGEVALSEISDQASTIRAGEPVLALDGLSLAGSYADVTLSVRPGEVVGITGSGSSGRIALAETIVGLRKASSGTMRIRGRASRGGSVPSALHAGVGFVPRDRHHEGFVESLSVAENLTMTIPARLGRWGFISPARRAQKARDAIDRLSIVSSGPEQIAGSLSGGNQQKIVMGRALANDPELLVLIHPTAGVDVRSKATLISVIESVRATGSAVVIVSDELDDLRPCDRVLVMLHGRVSLELMRGWADSDIVAATEGISVDHA